jgi:excisionase family DNA binding protein
MMMLWTVKDLVHWLQMKPSTVYAWAAQGRIPSLKIHGLLRFRPEEVAQWVESFRQSRPKSVPTGSRTGDRVEVNALIARARREVYSTRHGETKPTSSLIRKEDDDGAR